MTLTGNHHLRSWVVFLIALLVGAALYISVQALQRQELALAWIAGWWTFTHFQHQHSLEKSRFFFELFNRFNERYDAMNDRLQIIAESEEFLEATDRAKVVDYFNLCAEEYMFYRRGYIPDDVYRSWRNGMDWYSKKERFVKVWKAERGTQSYYGFEFISNDR